MPQNPSYYDSSYHSRHSQRAERKARLIAARIRTGGSIVDIGCNAGLISKALLERKVVSDVTGVEIDGSVLHAFLKEHPEFSLIEREIQETEFSRSFDSAIYFSVHHHVAAHHGIDVAVRTLRHIANHCRETLFFETGKICEGSYWPWQQKLRRYFRFDEEHYCYLFRCLEDLIEDFKIIGYNRIHGVRRELFELRMRPSADREMRQAGLTRLQYSPTLPSDIQSETLNSSPFTVTARLRDEQGTSLLWKSHLGNPLGNIREHEISASLDSDWAVRSLGIHPDDGVVFPLVESIEGDLSSGRELTRERRRALASQLQSIRKELLSKTAVCSEPFHPGRTERRLYRVCDFNPSNFLTVRDDRGDLRIRVVDFAYQAPSYAWKNDLNFARAFASLAERPLLRTRLRLSGSVRLVLKLITHQFLSRRQRIVNRFPSLFSALFTEVVSLIGLQARRLRRSGRA